MHRCRHRPLGFQIILVAFQHDKHFTPGFKYCLYHTPLAFAARYMSPTPVPHLLPGCQLFPAQLHYTNPSSRSQHTILGGDSVIWGTLTFLWCSSTSLHFLLARWLQISSSALAHSPPVRRIGLHVSQRPRFFCLFPLALSLFIFAFVAWKKSKTWWHLLYRVCDHIDRMSWSQSTRSLLSELHGPYLLSKFK